MEVPQGPAPPRPLCILGRPGWGGGVKGHQASLRVNKDGGRACRGAGGLLHSRRSSHSEVSHCLYR